MSSSVLSEDRLSALGRRAGTPAIARLMSLALERPQVLSLAAGFTDTRTLPAAAVGAAVAALGRRTGDPEYLQYGRNQGRPALRRLLGERLRQWEPELAADGIEQRMLITNGSQQALYLAIQVLCDPGDIVLVDRPSYFVFLEMLAGLGVRAVSLPVDGGGRVDAPGLRALLARLKAAGDLGRVKAVYLVSYFSNPSGRSMDAEEKDAVAAALADQKLFVPVLEDAAYRELYFRAPPAAPSVLLRLAWREFPKLYLATLTKPFATGLKVGFSYCSDEGLLARMLHVKGHQDFGTANFTQAIFEEVFERGGFERQLAVIRPAYEHKMSALHETLESEGLRAAGWRWNAPAGGLYLWLEAPAALDTGVDSAFCRACLEAGVIYVPGELCFGDAPARNFVRLSFGVLDEGGLREAGRRFARVARAVRL